MSADIKETYGSHIKDLRIEMGLTQNQVAEALNVTPGYISNEEMSGIGPVYATSRIL